MDVWYPRPESNRQALRRGIFFPLRLSPPPSPKKRRSWAGARLHRSLSALGARRLLSTPSQAILPRAWLGVGSAANAARAFAEFDGFHFRRFRRKAQILSPLCLPIPPPGLGATTLALSFGKSFSEANASQPIPLIIPRQSGV